MSEWFYIRIAFGVTYVAVAAYLLLLNRRRVVAETALRNDGRGAK